MDMVIHPGLFNVVKPQHKLYPLSITVLSLSFVYAIGLALCCSTWISHAHLDIIVRAGFVSLMSLSPTQLACTETWFQGLWRVAV